MPPWVASIVQVAVPELSVVVELVQAVAPADPLTSQVMLPVGGPPGWAGDGGGERDWVAEGDRPGIGDGVGRGGFGYRDAAVPEEGA